jgi:hypothetical protein
MRVSAAVLLFSLCTAFHAPLVVASRDSGMDCCAGGGMAVCCLVAGHCSLQSPSSAAAGPASMTAFALPSAAGFERPVAAVFVRAIDSARVSSGILLPPDPPPRA